MRHCIAKAISDTMRLVLALLATACARPTVREIRNLNEYERLIQHHKTETGLPVVVDFYSDSCGPCRMIAPAFKKLAKEMKDRAVFAKVNVAMARDVASRMRVSSMPTFHFYEDGVKRHEFSGAGEYQLRQLAERVANDAAAKNVKLSTEALRAFYDEHDAGKDIAPIIKKCASLAKSKDCVGGAARELAKKLKQKFGSAPQLTKRFGEQEPPKPKPKRTSRSLDQASTDELLAELAKRSDDDDLAFAATEAAELARKELEEEDEEDDEEDDEGALPLYRPHGQFAERVVIVGAGPGGLSAAVYAARAGLAPVVIAPSDGGQLLGKGVTVENYPGIVQRPFLAYPGHASLAWSGATATPSTRHAVDAPRSTARRQSRRWRGGGVAFRFECPREYDARRADAVGAAPPI